MSQCAPTHFSSFCIAKHWSSPSQDNWDILSILLMIRINHEQRKVMAKRRVPCLVRKGGGGRRGLCEGGGPAGVKGCRAKGCEGERGA